MFLLKKKTYVNLVILFCVQRRCIYSNFDLAWILLTIIYQYDKF